MSLRCLPGLDGRMAFENAKLGIVARDLIIRAIAERHSDHIAVLVNNPVGDPRLIDKRQRQGPHEARRKASGDRIADIKECVAKSHLFRSQSAYREGCKISQITWGITDALHRSSK